ncbi:MAG: carbamoyltransferase HypF [Methanobacteriaceae archaeon]|nr:carbamoyltransferase HypF [Methanobacteriaceae archaeon]
METTKILVEGIVQGVGFRPFVYRIATELGLNGYVRNLGNVVEIIIQGNDNQINNFLDKLQNELPPIAKLNNLETIEIDKKDPEYTNYNNGNDYTDFTIKKSADSFSGVSVIPPDLAICDKCLEEINDPNNRRYKHPFNACTDCGPRFTVIENVPYDREKTTMEDFPLCEECEIEYTNPLDRRYHAEASCCPKCGPSLQLYKNTTKENSEGQEEKESVLIQSDDPLKDTAKLLDDGAIFAIKGIGGTHLVANVKLEETIKLLRERLGRESQAFAVMSPDIETVRKFAIVSEEEEKTLISKERPIVILKKNENYDFAESVSPQLHNIGVMLPYAPLHHLLFNETDSPAYIMTSANVPGEPMMITNQEILENLDKIADYYLVHNRRILNRCDDSVVRFRSGELSFIRRSRGYTPDPYDLKGKYTYLNPKFDDLNILSLGPELDVTFTLLKQSKAYTSQHIGNTNKFRTYQFLQEAIKHMMNITKTNHFDAIACDLHPQFFTTKLAKELAEKYNCPLIQVQHHHAHGIALVNDHINNKNEYETNENKIYNETNETNQDMVIIAADGVGYGDDGGAWGGEILYTNIKDYERIGSLMPQNMPGGDLCTKYPVRMLASILANENSEYEKDEFNKESIAELMKNNYLDYFPQKEMEIKMLFKQIESNLNVGISTSTGRVLDSISTALHICSERGYEGEASMKLESFAYGLDLKNNSTNSTIEPLNDYPIIIKEYDNRLTLDTTAILRYIIKKIQEGEDLQKIAITGQKAVSIGLAELAIQCADKKGIKTIGATGGCFYNEAITAYIKDYVESKGYKFIQHINSCPGDGSVSVGQAIVAGVNLI